MLPYLGVATPRAGRQSLMFILCPVCSQGRVPAELSAAPAPPAQLHGLRARLGWLGLAAQASTWVRGLLLCVAIPAAQSQPGLGLWHPPSTAVLLGAGGAPLVSVGAGWDHPALCSGGGCSNGPWQGLMSCPLLPFLSFHSLRPISLLSQLSRLPCA